MITVKEFDEIVDELTEKMQYISTGLESLWQHVYHLETSVGNEETRIIGDKMVTPRGYKNV